MPDATIDGRRETFGDALRDVLVNTCSNGPCKGLLLLPFPTGVGKTYAVKRAIAGLVRKRSAESAPIVFLTPQHKNIPSRDKMQGLLKESGVEVGEHDVLYLKSVTETLLQNANDSVRSSIPDEIRRKTESDRLFDYVRLLRDRDGDCGTVDFLTREFSEFRRRVARILPDVGREQLLDLIEGDETWKWIGQLWPQVFASRAKVLLMTAKKFFLPFDTLVEPVRSLDAYDWMRSSIVFMDEFDSVKTEVLDVLVSQATRHSTDLPVLVKSLWENVDVARLPASLFEGEGGKRSRRSVERLKEKLDEVASELHVEYAYKAQEGILNQRGLFTYDGTRGGISAANRYFVVTDPKACENVILSKGAPGARSLSQDVGRLRGVIRYAQRVVATLLRNGRGNALSDLHDDALRDEIDSLLRAFGVEDRDARALMEGGVRACLNGRPGGSKGVAGGANVYDQGFGLVRLNDSANHRFATHINVYAMDESPESRLAALMKHSLVVGISATAEIDSPCSNFDLSWLREQFPEMILHVGERDGRRLRDAFARHVMGYDAVDIQVRPIEVDCSKSGGCPDLARQIVDRRRILLRVQNLLGKVSRLREGDERLDAARRYVRIAKAYRYFLENVPQGVFLCVTTRAPRRDGSLYSTEEIEALLGFVRDDLGVDGNADAVRFIENSRDFQKQYEDITAGLGTDFERIFVCASYGSLATGVNLQYTFDQMDTVRVGDANFGDEIDVVGIYLDRVTNMAPTKTRLSDENYDEDFLTCVFELRELYWHGDISEENLDDAQEMLVGRWPRNGRTVALTKVPSIKRAMTAACTQMVGRMCRTQNKARRIHILYDEDLVNRCDPEALGSSIVGPETELFLKRLSAGSPRNEDGKSRLERQLAVRGTALATELNKRVSSGWSSQADIEEWEEMRSVALSHPCPTKVELGSMGTIRHCFGEVGEEVTSYRYSSLNDYTKCCVSFDSVDEEQFPVEVSARSARLGVLSGVDVVRRHFESHGWALSWHPTGYMMCPSMFSNIYLGAVGEQAGKAILEAGITGLSLTPISDPSEYEKFDFVAPETRFYVDFKNWRSRGTFADESALRRIEEKAKAVGASCCAIVNLMAGEKFEDMRCHDHRNGIFEVPYLIDTNGKIAYNRVIELREWLRKQGVLR